jgi:hypothetical protein
MPAAGLSRRPRARERVERGLIPTAAAFSTIAIATVGSVALVVWSAAPQSWHSLIADEQRTSATALTVVSILANNILICCLPLLAGVFAHRLVARGRRGWARAVIAVAAVGVMRSLLIVGLVGGLDPAWLAGAAAWWIPEATALGTCCAAGWQGLRRDDSSAVARHLTHALVFAVVLLCLAAVVEVALT